MGRCPQTNRVSKIKADWENLIRFVIILQKYTKKDL